MSEYLNYSKEKIEIFLFIYKLKYYTKILNRFMIIAKNSSTSVSTSNRN